MNRLLVLDGDTAVFKHYDFLRGVGGIWFCVLTDEPGFICTNMNTCLSIYDYALNKHIRKHFKNNLAIIDPECFMHYIFNKQIYIRQVIMYKMLDFLVNAMR